MVSHLVVFHQGGLSLRCSDWGGLSLGWSLTDMVSDWDGLSSGVLLYFSLIRMTGAQDSLARCMKSGRTRGHCSHTSLFAGHTKCHCSDALLFADHAKCHCSHSLFHWRSHQSLFSCSLVTVFRSHQLCAGFI